MDTPQIVHPDERLNPTARALLEFLRSSDGSSAVASVQDLPPQAWEETIALALRHGVGPLLQRALRKCDRLAKLSEYLQLRLEEDRRATALDNLRNYAEFRRIARALQKRGIPVIALKGLHLAELVYRDISLRRMGDLDILVPLAQVEHAVAALQTLDYSSNGLPPSLHDVALTHGRMGILVEVHWTLAEPTETYVPPIEEIWRLAVPVKLGDADALVMSPELLLLHVCVHLAYHHFFAFDLRALCDIVEIVRAYPALDWAAVVDLGRRHHCGRGIAVALSLARDHLGAAVPADALEAIGGDALDPDLLGDALEQLATYVEISNELRFAPNLMAFTGASGAREKVAALWKRILVPRTELGQIYGVSEHSARINFYYAVRLRDLVRSYAASARELIVSGPQLTATAARNERLSKWMAGA